MPHGGSPIRAGPKLRTVARRSDSDPTSAGAATSRPRRVRRATTTSNFGVSKRESHDSSEFYARFSAPVMDLDARPAGTDADRALDRVILGDARRMEEVASGSVALVVTSPPYFAGKEYEEALGEGHVPGSYLDYLGMLADVFAECVRCLEPGGRIAVNVANLGRRPYRSLSGDVTSILQDRLGLLLRGEIIWQKQRGAGGNCAWGSFQRPGNPVLRDTTERVVVASKDRFDRALTPARRAELGLPSEATISRDEFIDATLDLWEFAAESATRVGHPAPFPVALPQRLIELHTYAGDLVLDPFMGSGTTALAAVRTDRHFVGYDTDATYVDLARERIRSELCEPSRPAPKRATRGSGGPRSARSQSTVVADSASDGVEPPGSSVQPPPEVSRAIAAGHSVRDVSEALLGAAGAATWRSDVRLPGGVAVTFAVPRADGTEVLIEVCGSFSSSRGGLNRVDVLWRALGKAAVVAAVGDSLLVLLSPEVPAAGTAAARPIDELLRVGSLAAVIDITAADAADRLREVLS